ncbi:MAG: hypothetical protein JW834_04845 [Candidatus Diapherotrites archaeon]|nr:hypothetical protein [Candidatus Diapherotrites archaeon]
MDLGEKQGLSLVIFEEQKYWTEKHVSSEFLNAMGAAKYPIMNYLPEDWILDCKEKIRERLAELFKRIIVENQALDEQLCSKVDAFFKSNEKELGENKENLPEGEDKELLTKTISKKDTFSKSFILSNDRHFKAYAVEIKTEYGIFVIEVDKLKGFIKEWGET